MKMLHRRCGQIRSATLPAIMPYNVNAITVGEAEIKQKSDKPQHKFLLQKY
jgi:hypothetical protein